MSTQDYSKMTLGQLKEVAKHMRVAVSKDASIEDIIESLNQKQRGKVVAQIADTDSGLKPGYARIVIDETQNSSRQTPVYMYDNGLEFTIPRGVPVDVPQRVVRHLQSSVVKRRRQIDGEDGRPKTVMSMVMQYPMQVLDINPGPEYKTKREEAAERLIGPRRRYRDMFGRWPRPYDMTRAIESGILSLDKNEDLPMAEIVLSDTK